MQLPSGLRSAVERRGRYVARYHAHPISPHTHPTLRLLGQRGWSGAPRLLSAGPPELLTWLPGIAPLRSSTPGWATTRHALHALGALIRQLHDLAAGTEIVGDAETMCHNDLSPANTVYDADRRLPYAFIDWDLAAPGERIADLGHAAWQWLGLGTSADIDAAARGIRTLLDGYGDGHTAREVVDAAIQWQLDTADGIEGGAAADPTLAALLDAGVPAECRSAASWTRAHADALTAAGV